MQLSRNIAAIAPSATFKFANKAKQLAAQGRDILNFSQGEPDFNTPAHIGEAAIQAIRDGKTRYTPSVGIPELRQAIADKLKRENGVSYAPEQIIVTCGVKQALYSILSSICNPGDEVIIPAPYWVSYPEQCKAIGAVGVIVLTQEANDFKLTPAELERAITPKTKALIFNTPGNPSGSVYSEAECKALAEVCVRKQVAIVSDEIYEHLVFGGRGHYCIAAASPAAQEWTFVVNGPAKAYAMTGWRIGFVAGPKDAMPGLARLQDHMTSNMNTPAQWATITALQGDQSCIAHFRGQYDERRQLAMRLLREMPGMTVREPFGAFYVFPNIQKLFGRTLGGRAIRNSEDFVDTVLEQVGLAFVPGSAFGMEGYFRMSIAASAANIERGLSKLRDFLK